MHEVRAFTSGPDDSLPPTAAFADTTAILIHLGDAAREEFRSRHARPNPCIVATQNDDSLILRPMPGHLMDD